MEDEQFDLQCTLPIDSDDEIQDYYNINNPQSSTYIQFQTPKKRLHEFANSQNDRDHLISLKQLLQTMQRPTSYKIKPRLFSTKKQIPMRKETQKLLTELQTKSIQNQQQKDFSINNTSNKPEVSEFYKKYVLNINNELQQQALRRKFNNQSRRSRPCSLSYNCNSSLGLLSLNNQICCQLSCVASTHTTCPYFNFFVNEQKVSHKNTIAWCSTFLMMATSNKVLFLDPQNKRVVNVIQMDNFAKVSSLNAHNNMLVIGETTGRVIVENVQNNKIINQFNNDQTVDSVDINQTNNTVTCSTKEEIRIFDIRSKKPLNKIHEKNVLNFKWSSSGNFLATKGNHLRIWDNRKLNTAIISQKYQFDNISLDWWPNSNILAFGKNGQIQNHVIVLWDISQNRYLKTMATKQAITALKFIPATRQIITTHMSKSNHINVWFVPNLWKTKQLTAVKNEVMVNLVVNKDLNIFATLSDNKTVSFWNMNQGPITTNTEQMNMQLR